MILRFFIFFGLVLFLVSCVDKEKELQLKQLELEVKEKDIELQKKNLELKEKQFRDSILEAERQFNSKLSLVDLYEENKQSVFFIVTGSSEGIPNGTGSGFFVRDDGLAVSNFHVFDKAHQAFIETSNGARYMISEIVEYNEELDFILFKINNVHQETFRPVNIAQTKPKIGEECFAIGNPQQLKSTLSKGIVSGIREAFIQTTAQINPGSSGGALFNEYGEVIGITTMMAKDNTADLNFALNIVGLDFKNMYSNQIKIQQTVQSKSSPNTENRRNEPEKEHRISPDERTTSVTVNEKNRVVGVLKILYDHIIDKDYDAQYYMYAPVLGRCYNKMNLSRDQVIQEQKSYDRTYPRQKFEIDYNSLDISKDYDGNFNVNYQGYFYIAKTTWNEYKRFNIDMFITFDNNMKIKGVYSNILN